MIKFKKKTKEDTSEWSSSWQIIKRSRHKRNKSIYKLEFRDEHDRRVFQWLLLDVQLYYWLDLLDTDHSLEDAIVKAASYIDSKWWEEPYVHEIVAGGKKSLLETSKEKENE